MSDLQTVIISGASSGIGAATAKIFAENNYDLLLLGRNQTRLNEMAQVCKTVNSKIKIEIISQDLNSLDEIELLKKLSSLAPLSTLINNAGIYEQASIEDTTSKIWNDMFQTNLMASVKLTHVCWGIFLRSHQGSIVNVASTLGISPIANTSAYSALKAALINWTMSLAIEGGAKNIRANAVAPGIIDTPIHPFHSLDIEKKKNIEAGIANIQLLPRLGKPEDVAESIFFLASSKSKFTTGSILNVDGGINIK